MNELGDPQIRLFGAIDVTVAGATVRLEYDKVRALLAYLAVEGARPVRRDTLTGLLWPEQDDKAARHSLSQALTSLRKSLQDEREHAPILLLDRTSVQLNPLAPCWIDSRELDIAVAKIGRHAHARPETCPTCAQSHAGVLALYRGPFLEGLTLNECAEFELWLAAQREHVHRLALASAEYLTRYHEWRSELGQARRYAQRQIDLEPWREEAHRQLMRILAHSGERTAALRQYAHCCRLLDEELGVEPAAETVALYAAIKRASANVRGNLPPQPTAMLGRHNEAAAVSALLAAPDCRLVTIVGTGGVGKTRLSLHVAEAKQPGFLDGVFFVPLASIDTADALAGAIAQAVGATFPASGNNWVYLANFLRRRELLLVLDNYEHLVEESDLLDELLRASPQLKILVTSRIRLQSDWEWVFELTGLETPSSSRAGEMLENAAVGLFVERARQLQPSFTLDAGNQTDIVRICALVEGLPLAIELAAAWTRALSCTEIARELDEGLDLLRRRTHASAAPSRPDLDSVFTRSWQLLTPAVQRACAQLSVFRAGFDRGAADAVAQVTLETLRTLVDTSLLRMDTSGRYAMHELLRRFAAERLEAQPDLHEITVGRFCAYFGARIEQYASPSARNRQQGADIRLDMENIRSVWMHLLQRADIVAITHCLNGMYRFHEIHNWDRQGAELFAAGLEKLPDIEATADVRARIAARLAVFSIRVAEYARATELLESSLREVRARELRREEVFCLFQMGNVLQHRGRFAEAGARFRASLELARELDDQQGMGAALHHLGHLANDLGEYKEAIEYFDQSLVHTQILEDEWGAANTLNNMGIAFYALGEYEAADECYRSSLARRRRLGSQWGIAATLNNLGLISMDQGDLEGAQVQFEESLSICSEIGDERGAAIASNNLGEIAWLQGNFRRAATYHQQSLETFTRIGHANGIVFSLNYLGQAYLGSSNTDAAERHFRQALALSRNNASTPRALDSLLGMAGVYARRGLQQRAIDLIEMILAHRACEQSTRQRARALRRDLLASDSAAGLTHAAPATPLDAVIATVLAAAEPASTVT